MKGPLQGTVTSPTFKRHWVGTCEPLGGLEPQSIYICASMSTT